MMLENKKKKILILSVLLVAFSLSLCISNINQGKIDSPNKELNLIENENQENLRTSEIDYYTDEELIKNGNFSDGTDYWYNSSQGQDISDVNSSISGGEAKFDILGSEETYTYRANPPNNTDWIEVPNPNFPNMTTTHEFRTNGLYVYHLWQDQTGVHQPSVHWEKNISLAEDMSDYTITNATINALVNATVGMDLDRYGDNEARDSGLGAMDTIGVGDYVRFYILISDLDKNLQYEVAYLQPDLGVGEPGFGHPTDTLADTLLIMVDDPVLMFYLTSVLGTDNHNFTVTLGIRLNIEDNNALAFDEDTFDAIYIKNFNISFTYQKNIDQNTDVSWNQDVDPIDSSYIIDNATLNFQYKIDAGTWPTSSPNSEFRILINNNQLGETVRLSTTTNSFQPAKIDGFDVSSLISAGQYVNLSIRAYFADDFELDRIITISIDNVSLKIDYGIERETHDTVYQLFFDGIDKTQEKSIKVPWQESLNISLEYNNESNGAFLSDAVVSINSSLSGISELMNHYGTNNYSIIINTTNFGLGNNYFTIDAYQKYYEPKSFDITVVVTERDTFIDNIYLNQTRQAYIEYPWNDTLDITMSYNDSLSNDFINGANVTLRSGETIIAEFDVQTSLKLYNLTLNTSADLSIGLNPLIIYTKQDNYTIAQAVISILVYDIETELVVFLNQTRGTSIEFPYGENLNITAIFKQRGTGDFIDQATVELKAGDTIIGALIKHPDYNQYNITINTVTLGVGVKSLAISADREDYSTLLVGIAITVTERETDLEVYLNQTISTSIEFPYGDLLNITTVYMDKIERNFLDDALVELRDGETVIGVLLKHTVHDHYNLTLNTENLAVGLNSLTLFAKQDNYTASIAYISIIVSEIETTLDVFLNGQNSINFEYFNVTIGETLNFTAIYYENGGSFLDTATVQISGDYTDDLDKHPILDQYNISILATNLGLGTKFLTISAKKVDYTLAKIDLKINVYAINTSLELLINGTTIKENEKYQAEVDWFINITVRYRESSDPYSHIDGATVRLINKGQLMENGLLEQYNISIKAEDLGQGFNILSIYAEKEGYQLRDISFIIEITEKATTSLILLNGSERVDNTYELTIGEFVNITLYYNVSNADIVELRGSGLTPVNLTYKGAYYYQTIISSENFTYGINTLTLYAYETNYEQQTNTIRIKIIDKKTEIDVFLDGIKYLTNSTIVLDDIPIGKPIVILVNFTEDITKDYIKNATVQLIGENLILNMSALISGEYSLTLDTNLLDLGVRFFSIYSYKANYQTHTVNLRITIKRISTKIETEDGENKIEVKVGETYTLKIKITNLDFGGRITNAEVSYQSDFVGVDLKEGELEETDDGIYEIKLEDLPEGTYTITITVSHENDNYDFSRYEITITVVREEEEVLLFQILTVVGITSAIGIGGYLFAYQRVLKYPKPIRIVRKFRHNLKKKNLGKGLDIPTRENSFRKEYEELLGKGFSLGKGKSAETEEITEKLVKKSPDTTSNNLPDNLK